MKMISTFSANMRSIMAFITTEFLETLLSGLGGAALTNCFSGILNFGRIFNIKRDITPRKKNQIRIFQPICSPSLFIITTKFHEILDLLSGFRGVALIKKTRTDELTVEKKYSNRCLICISGC